jgi:hypothetical protein
MERGAFLSMLCLFQVKTLHIVFVLPEKRELSMHAVWHLICKPSCGAMLRQALLKFAGTNEGRELNYEFFGLLLALCRNLCGKWYGVSLGLRPGASSLSAIILWTIFVVNRILFPVAVALWWIRASGGNVRSFGRWLHSAVVHLARSDSGDFALLLWRIRAVVAMVCALVVVWGVAVPWARTICVAERLLPTTRWFQLHPLLRACRAVIGAGCDPAIDELLGMNPSLTWTTEGLLLECFFQHLVLLRSASPWRRRQLLGVIAVYVGTTHLMAYYRFSKWKRYSFNHLGAVEVVLGIVLLYLAQAVPNHRSHHGASWRDKMFKVVLFIMLLLLIVIEWHLRY